MAYTTNYVYWDRMGSGSILSWVSTSTSSTWWSYTISDWMSFQEYVMEYAGGVWYARKKKRDLNLSVLSLILDSKKLYELTKK
jgi:hypothetical protein